MVKKLTYFFCFLAVTVLPKLIMAAPIVPNPGGSSPSTPIDGGIAILVAAGAAYGVKKAIDLKKKK